MATLCPASYGPSKTVEVITMILRTGKLMGLLSPQALKDSALSGPDCATPLGPPEMGDRAKADPRQVGAMGGLRLVEAGSSRRGLYESCRWRVRERQTSGWLHSEVRMTGKGASRAWLWVGVGLQSPKCSFPVHLKQPT